MSPPAAIFESAPVMTTTNGGLKDKLTPEVLSFTTQGQQQTKLLDEFAGKWDNFKFAPIRESQVSRAMTTSMTLTSMRRVTLSLSVLVLAV
jgi:thiamine thiazole synthase